MVTYLVFTTYISAHSVDRPRHPSPNLITRIELVPSFLGQEIDLFISNILSEVKTMLWKEQYFNPQNGKSRLEVRVDIMCGKTFRGYVLSSPPLVTDEDTLKTTSSFSNTLQKDLYHDIVNNEKFKKLYVSGGADETGTGGECHAITEKS